MTSAAASLRGILEALDQEQRGAALLPDGPAQVIAPAGSGKTTTLIARLGVLLERGAAPERILVVTFNRDAALELASRIAARLVPVQPSAVRIEVRTLHALGRQVMLDAGWRGRLVADRIPLLRRARRSVAGRGPTGAELPSVEQLDVAVSAAKLAGEAPSGVAAEILEAYRSSLDREGALDFDDLIARPLDLLETRRPLRDRWQSRFTHVLVDEFQDVDAAQLRLIRLLAEPQRNLFAVGDDDQTIYAWRLADVRRILDFGISYPDARRVILATNYRCPAGVVEASSRLIGVNDERFAKQIRAAPRTVARTADVVTFGTPGAGWPDRLVELVRGRVAAGSSACFLARTRSELMPVALALIRLGVPHAMAQGSPLEAAPVVELLDATRGLEDRLPYEALRASREARGWRRASETSLTTDDHDALDALLGWAAGHTSVARFVAAYDSARERLAALRRPDAPIRLMTVHAAKGLEFPIVVVLGFEHDRFPNRRAVAEASDPARALEDERRLAYVALTRASEQLILAFDPARPSRFIREMAEARDPRPRRPP